MADDGIDDAYRDDYFGNGGDAANDGIDDADYSDDVDDDFYSLDDATDDYWRYKDSYASGYRDDDDYYSTKRATSWLDSLLSNTAASKEGKLTPVQDINPDNVLATLWFNCFVCVALLGLYELLRRWIPSVYSQRLVYGNEAYNSSGSGSGRGEGCNGGTSVIETAMEACADPRLKQNSPIVASGRSLGRLRSEGSVLNARSSEEEEGGKEKGKFDNDGGDADENSLTSACATPQQEVCDHLQRSGTDMQRGVREGDYSYRCWRQSCSLPVLEWCVSVHNTPWTTLRQIAGLDAYFYLRYIRMCLKITAVSSFWAIVILCPVYATGGGNQSGFYHFSMANVLQGDRGRVWVPTIFCWLFTMYCCFCVRDEMIHYVELRMNFLGGEEEQRILKKRSREFKREVQRGWGSYTAPKVAHDTGSIGGAESNFSPKVTDVSSTIGEAGSSLAPKVTWSSSSIEGARMRQESEAREEDGNHAITENTDPSLSCHDTESNEQRSRSSSPIHASEGVVVVFAESCPSTSTANTAAASAHASIPSIHLASTKAADDVQKQMKQHRYSLQVEKVPVELRSNTALFDYFNEMFPNQVHSACIAMNVPELVALSARRLRVCRRLEKSLAYHCVTGTRPMHIAGRPRCRCCGIESTPIDGGCLALCCFYDSMQIEKYRGRVGHVGDYPAGGEGRPPEAYETLPDKGECVDSILYYTLELAKCNLQMRKLQREHFRIAERGESAAHRATSSAVVDESNCDWYSQLPGMIKRGAAMTAEGLREEFEVPGLEDYLGDGIPSVNFGAGAGFDSLPVFPTSSNDQGRVRRRGRVKRECLVAEEHLSDSEERQYREGFYEPPSVRGHREDFGGEAARQRKVHYNRPYTWVRALLWRMGVDFLAAGLDEVRSRTDVVVDNVTRPAMSSTGFVTFKTLTPVTVTTSAPLTYNHNPMEVHVAPEPRDLVWQNVQIDQDIGASRAFVANVLLGLGVLLWSIPLTLIQAWAKVENVALIPGLEWVDQIHGGSWKPFVNGYLPVITLLGLILLLPLIFQWVATSYEKRKTLSGVQNSIVGRYFYYQLANIYITVTAGALWTSLAEIIDHPQKLLVILGETLPKLAGYFISLLITKTLAGLPMVLLRAGALSRMMFLRSCFNKKRLTQRELKEVYRKQPIYYGWEYPTQFLVIIICFTYACITPFVLPVGAAYYFVALLVYKKQALYVYTPTYESGGRMFPQAVSKTLFALLISQLTFIGYTLIRKGVFQIILLAPLPFLTVFFTLFIKRRFVEPSKMLSLERAVKIDALLDQSAEFSDEAYQQPVLTEKASIPVCETDDFILTEVIESLGRLQNESQSDLSYETI